MITNVAIYVALALIVVGACFLIEILIRDWERR